MEVIKKYKSAFWAFVILSVSLLGYTFLSKTTDEKEESNISNVILKVPVKQVTPINQNVVLDVLANIQARQYFDIYTEVNGVLEDGKKPFLSATHFKKGQVLARINSDQFRADLSSRKSGFKSSLVSILAILKLDFPNSFKDWHQYLNKISPQSPLQKLPKYKSEKESLFFISRGIEEQYYQIKSLEELLRKYTIVAPFDGFLLDIQSKKGTMVSPNQRLGAFIGKNQFDVVMDIKKEYVSWISTKDTLLLKGGKSALIKRVSNAIDQNTQTVQLFATIEDDLLVHGDFIPGTIKTSKKVKGNIIDRKLLNSDNTIWVYENGRTKKIIVKPIIATDSHTLISGFDKPLTILEKTTGIKVGQKIAPIYSTNNNVTYNN
ncbi:efflux RND transporter periplasmic adaptor subunit [Aquimarina rhabdastrellae]